MPAAIYRQSIAYIGETPWHRIGTRVQDPAVQKSVEAFMKAANIWYRAEAQPCYTEINGEKIALETQAIVRDTDHAIIGEVGSKYTVIQHTDQFMMLQRAIDAGLLTCAVAGALGDKGATVWLLAALSGLQPQEITSADRDVLRPYVLASTAHDGSRVFLMQPTSVRVVCQNTLSAADAEAESGQIRRWKVTHTASADSMLRAIDRQIDQAVKAFDQQVSDARAMGQHALTLDQMKAFMLTVFPDPPRPASTPRASVVNGEVTLTSPTTTTTKEDDLLKVWQRKCDLVADQERKQALKLAFEGAGNKGETVWHALNGITELVDHTAKASTPTSKLSAATGAIFGAGAALKAHAWTLAKRIAVAA